MRVRVRASVRVRVCVRVRVRVLVRALLHMWGPVHIDSKEQLGRKVSAREIGKRGADLRIALARADGCTSQCGDSMVRHEVASNCATVHV